MSDGKLVCAHIAKGEAYFGAVECPETALIDDPLERIGLAKHLEGSAQLADFSSRVAQELRRLQPIRVGVVRTRKYQGWVYRDAFSRIAPEVAIMLTCEGLGVPYEQVRQEDAAKALQLPPQFLVDRAAERLGVERSRYWQYRAWAFAGARWLAKEHCK